MVLHLTGINASNVTISGAGNTEQVQRVLLASGTGSTSIVNDGGIFYKPSSNKLTVIGTVSAGSFEGDGSNLTGITAADADFADVAGVATNVNGGIVTATTVSAAGSITAANFYGDGSNLIGVSAGDADFADVAGVATNVNGGIATVTKLDSPNTIVSIGANLIPDTNEAYDLGSATNRFNDLYLSGNTIDLGGIQLRSVANNLGVGGTQVVLQGQDFTGNAATATTATRAETVEVASSETGGNENARLTFVVDGVDPDLNRFDALNINTQLRFNRTAGRLYATEFQGDGSRLTNVTAGVATDVDLNQDTTSATEKRLIFGANGSNGSQRLEVDTSLDGIRYVPSTSTLFVSNIEANLVGNITGTATTATRAETVDVASVGNNTARYLTFVDSSGTATGQQVRVNSQIQAIAGTGKLIANNFQGGGGLLTALNASQLTEGTVPAARITDIGDVNANVITLLNVEKDDLSVDGQFGFDSSQGLLIHRTQQGAPTPDGATTTVLDGWNVRAGTGISITNLGAGGSGTQAFTFSIDSNASIENAIRAQTVDIEATGANPPNVAYGVILGDGTGDGKNLLSDGGLTYNPSTNTLLVQNGTIRAGGTSTFSGDGSGLTNVTADSATTAGTATTATNVNVANAGTGTRSIILSSGTTTGSQGLTRDAALTYNASTDTIVANISGSATSATTAGTATTATNANNVEVSSNDTDPTTYVTFVNNTDDPYQRIRINQKLVFNSSSGKLIATSFQGDGSQLTGISASNVTISGAGQTSDVQRVLLANGTGNKSIVNDGGLTYTPSSNNLSVAGIVSAASFDGDGSNLTGITADSADVATTAENIDVTSAGNNTPRYLTFVASSGTATGQQVRVNSQIQAIASTGKLIANNFEGGGGLLTSLNAAELTAGEIPQDRFPDAIEADITGTATTATDAVKVGITTNEGGANQSARLTFVVDGSPDTDRFDNLNINSKLRFNRAAGRLYATEFEGDGSGLTNVTAGVATDVNLNQSNNSITEKRLIFGANGDIPGSQRLEIDTSEDGIRYVPSTSTLFVTNITGTASSATNAANAGVLNPGANINGSLFTGENDITITANTPQSLTPGQYITGFAFDGEIARTWDIDATSANTPNTIVARNANGDFNSRNVSVTNLISSGEVRAGNGASNNPSITFGNDSDTGIYSVSANVGGLAAGGTEAARWDSTRFGVGLTQNRYLQIGDGSQNNTNLRIYKRGNNISDHIQFYNGTTRMGEIGVQDTTWLRINQVTAKNIFTPRMFRADGGFQVDGSFVIDANGVHVGDGSGLTNVTAGVATDVNLNQSNNSTTAKALIFGANGTTSGSQRLEVDTSGDGIRYVPDSSTLIVTNITGTASNATNAASADVSNRAETVDVTASSNAVIRYLTFVNSSENATEQTVRVNPAFKTNTSNGTLSATIFAGSGSGLTSLNASQLSTGTVPAGRITELGDVNANVITLLNVEKDDLSVDGQFGFDASQGLLIHRTQQGAPTPDGATTTVLDGWNVKAGTGISITNLGAGGTGTQTFTFSIDSNATIANATRAQTVDITGTGADIAYRVTLGDGTGTGKNLLSDGGLTYNPSTNTLLVQNGTISAGGTSTFSGNGSNLTSVTASRVDITGAGVTTLDRYIFLSNTTNGSSPGIVDPDFKYKPSTNTLTVPNLTVTNTITGNADTATTATNCSRQVIAGNGLTGGGTLNADRTLNVVGGTNGGISVAADSISVDTTVVRTSGAQTIGGAKTFTNNVRLNDNVQIQFGTANPSTLRRDATNMIMDMKAGTFFIRNTESTAAIVHSFARTGNYTAAGVVKGSELIGTNVTGTNATMTIQPQDAGQGRDLILRGNKDTNSLGGGNVRIGDIERQRVLFYTRLSDGYRFHKEGTTNISGRLTFSRLSANRTYTFPDAGGTIGFENQTLIRSDDSNAAHVPVLGANITWDNAAVTGDFQRQTTCLKTKSINGTVSRFSFNRATGDVVASSFFGRGTVRYGIRIRNGATNSGNRRFFNVDSITFTGSGTTVDDNRELQIAYSTPAPSNLRINLAHSATCRSDRYAGVYMVGPRGGDTNLDDANGAGYAFYTSRNESDGTPLPVNATLISEISVLIFDITANTGTQTYNTSF